MTTDRPTPDARAAVVAEALKAHNYERGWCKCRYAPMTTDDQFAHVAAAILAALDTPATGPDTTDPADGLSEDERGSIDLAFIDAKAGSTKAPHYVVERILATQARPSHAKWREAGWSSPDEVLQALTNLRIGVTEVRKSFSPMVGQGSGAYLNPRVVVARLDALLSNPLEAANTLTARQRPTQQTSAERVVEAVEELAAEWEALADWVDDPDSTPDQRARSRAGVIAAEQLRAALDAVREADTRGGVDA